MSRLIILVPLILFCGAGLLGQQRQPAQPSVDVFPKGGILFPEKDLPLIIIGSYTTNAASLIMDPDNLRILLTYQEPDELKHFGEKGNHGVIVAELKTKVPLLRLEEVLDYYKVPAANRRLPVLVDKKAVHADLFLADIRKIKKIEVIEVSQEDVVLSLFYNRWAPGERYLNIVTLPE